MAVLKTLANPYRAAGAQEVDAYCVARVDAFDLDLRRCVVRIDAYDGVCDRAQRAAGLVLPFKAARTERIAGDLFDAFFSVEALKGSNLIRQAYLCACRPVTINKTQTNEWCGLKEV